MNTIEVKLKNRIKNWEDFYKEGKKQFLAYEKIEGIDNWKEYDFSIDSGSDQMKFKDMIQIRFIEELTEASAALNEKEHFWEEITDSLNFFISSFIMLNINFNKLPNPEKYLSKKDKRKIPSFKKFSIMTYPLIHNVGNLCNLLKNRPWAQSNYLVSLFDFNERLEKLWINFWKYLGKLGIDKITLFDLFERKILVNQFRMKTGY